MENHINASDQVMRRERGESRKDQEGDITYGNCLCMCVTLYSVRDSMSADSVHTAASKMHVVNVTVRTTHDET